MVTKLHRDALESDIASVKAILAGLENAESLNAVQLKHRLVKLEEELAAFDKEAKSEASVALIFDGGPVTGSSAIDASFAGKALADFQEMVTKQVASSDFGGMAEKGRIAEEVHNASKMDITSLVHGSFGFVLTESRSSEPEFFNSAAKNAVEEVANILNDVGAIGTKGFEERLRSVDARLFATLKRFVALLHKGGATLRISESERDTTFSAETLERAHERLKDSEVVEEDELVHGELLGLVPIQRRFDFRREDTGDVVKGQVAANLSDSYLERVEREGTVAGKRWRAVIRTKTIARPDGRSAAISHTLIDLIEDGKKQGLGETQA